MTIPVKTIQIIFYFLLIELIVFANVSLAAAEEPSNANVTQVEDDEGAGGEGGEGNSELSDELADVIFEVARDELDRWVPALSISMGALLQRASGDSRTNDVNRIEADPSTDLFSLVEVREPADGQDLIFSPVARISLELMTPGLVTIPGRPRLFIHGDLDLNFSQEYDLAKEGNLRPFEIDRLVVDPAERVILGQGTVFQANVSEVALSAGLGVAFTLDIFDRRVRIKPSFEWLREKIILDGRLRRLIKNPIGAPPLELDDFRQILLSRKKTKVYHGIGPGLEIEVDGKRAGQIAVSTFMGTRIHRIMGSLDANQSASNEFNETVFFHYKNRRWAYQAFMGIRLRLVPEE